MASSIEACLVDESGTLAAWGIQPLMRHQPTTSQVEQGMGLLLGGQPPGRAAGVGIHAPELEELLRAAAAVRSLPRPPATPEVRARVKGLVMAQAESRRVAWVHSHALPHRSRAVRRPRKLRRVWAVGGLLLLAMIGGIALSAATSLSQPDSAFYPLKRTTEGVLVTMSVDPVTRADFEVKLADIRLREAASMVSNNRFELAVTAVRDHYQELRLAAADLGGATRRGPKWKQAHDHFLVQEAQPVTSIQNGLHDKAQAQALAASELVRTEAERFGEDRKELDRQLSQPTTTRGPVPDAQPTPS